MNFRKIRLNPDLPALAHEECQAKTTEDKRPGLSVYEHCENVGRVAEALALLLPAAVIERFPWAPGLVAALHDVGKVSPGFQLKYFRGFLAAKVPELALYSVDNFCTDHALIGACAAWHRLGDLFNCPELAQIVAIHHGSIKESPRHSDTGERFGGVSWSNERGKLLDKIESEFGRMENLEVSPVIRNCLAGLTTVADWIGSDETFFPAAGLPITANSVETARRAVEVCGFRKPRIIPDLNFNDIFGFSPHPIQSQFCELVTGPGLYIMEAPMGLGKTEAALFAAYKLMHNASNSGIFFGLPTRLTSDRIHERVQEFLEKICPDYNDVKLAHGTAWLKSFESGGESFRAGQPWFNPRKRSLLHPFVVGTIDQALFSVLRVKHYFVRTFALAGKVVILDEVHSYDMYTGSLLDEMVRHLLELGCSVIILSATLTAERRRAFFTQPEQMPGANDYPLLSRQAADSVDCFPAPALAARTVNIQFAAWSPSEVAAAAIAKARAGNCVLAIANSVAKAQAWFAAIAADMNQDEFSVGLLHSKFPGCRRAEIEDKWMSMLGKPDASVARPDACILVATQVVEQSVDIDADFLITELAPTDMLLQRLGRLWRHERAHRPGISAQTVLVLEHPVTDTSIDDLIRSFGKANCMIYAPYVLWRTFKVWQAHESVILPTDIRSLLEATYSAETHDNPVITELYSRFIEHREKLRQISMAARATVTAMPVGEDKEGVATRYSDLPTAQALLLRKIDSTGDQAELTLLDGSIVKVSAWQADFSVTATLHRNLVSLASYLLGATANDKPPLFLSKHFYEPTALLIIEEGTGDLFQNSRSSGLRYTPDYGIFKIPETTSVPGSFASEYDDLNVFDKTRFDW